MNKIKALLAWPKKPNNNLKPAYRVVPRLVLWLIGAPLYWAAVYLACFGLYLMTLDFWQVKDFRDDAI